MTEALKKSADQKFCSECGSIINIKAEICPHCGVRQLSAPSVHNAVAQNGSNKLTAGLLGILLGGFGAHKFYLGQTGKGILYLLFCWTFIPSIIGLIEGIQYLSMSDSSFNVKYGQP